MFVYIWEFVTWPFTELWDGWYDYRRCFDSEDALRLFFTAVIGLFSAVVVFRFAPAKMIRVVEKITIVRSPWWKFWK